MADVIEYGENIGTLKNIFCDLQQAVIFAQKIIDISDNKYECVGRYRWYCSEKKEYVKIEDG